MIDSIKLRLTDYTIKPKAKLIKQPALEDNETGKKQHEYTLYKDRQTEIIGNKAFHNAENFNVNLLMKRGMPFLFTQFSVPKYVFKDNYTIPNDIDVLKKALTGIEKDLKSIGIHTNINESKISRLDLTQNVHTKHDFALYEPLFDKLQVNRTNKRAYPGAFLYHNTQQELMIYDKLAEMQYRKIQTKGLPNTQRYELRFLNSQKVKNSLGIHTATDLLSIYPDLLPYHSNYIIDKLFSTELYKTKIYDSEYYNQIARLSMKNGKLSVATIMKLVGLSNIIYIPSQEKMFLKAIGKHATNKMTIIRAKKQIQNAKIILLGTANEIDLDILYNEIKDYFKKTA